MSTSTWFELSAARDTLTPETERDRRRRRILVLCAPFLVLAAVAAFVPLATMVRMSVSTDRFANVGFSASAWRTLATDPLYRQVAVNTLWFAAATSAVSVALGVAVSHAFAKYSLPFERVLVSVVSFPIALPGIVVAFMVVALLGRQGLVTNAVAFFSGQGPIDLATATTVTGLFVGYVYSLLPRATMVLRGTYAEVNTDAEQAARALGADPLRTFYYVTLPEIRPGIVAALLLTFRTALAIFGTVLVLQGLNVATLQLSQVISVGYESQIAAGIGLVYFAFILAVTFVGLRYTEADVIRR